MRTSLGLLLLVSSLSAQRLSIGLIGGGTLTDAARDTTTVLPNSGYNWRVWSQSKDWLAGGMIEYHFTPSFSMEADGMYRELHLSTAGVMPDGTLNSVSPSPVVSWEFPVLAKYRLRPGILRPFVEGGPAFRTTGNLNFAPSHYGVTAGAGVEAGWRGFTFAPVLRYTRWAGDAETRRLGRTQQNQVELLLAISRRAKSHWNPGGGRVSLGAIFGWGLNADYPSYTRVEPGQPTMTRKYTGLTSMIAGPSIEVHLPAHWSVEIAALHKSLRIHSDTTFDNGAPPQSDTWTEAGTWQFPLLARYRVPLGRLTPFVEAGPSFRLPQFQLATHGITAGAGLELRYGAVQLAPGLRFTRWGAETLSWTTGVTRNEVSLLLGVSVGGRQRQRS